MIKEETFSFQRLKTKQGYLFSLLLLNTVLKNLASVITEEKKKHMNWIGKKKLFLFMDDNYVH